MSYQRVIPRDFLANMNTMTNTARAVASLTPGTIAARSHHLGNDCAEPLYVIPRLAHRYAVAHEKRFRLQAGGGLRFGAVVSRDDQRHA